MVVTTFSRASNVPHSFIQKLHLDMALHARFADVVSITTVMIFPTVSSHFGIAEIFVWFIIAYRTRIADECGSVPCGHIRINLPRSNETNMRVVD
jgi:hypothetical protein